MSEAPPAPPTRPRTFLVAQDTSVSPAGAGPLDFGWLVEQLQQVPGTEVRKTLKPLTFRAQNLGTSVTDEVVVATMSETTAAELRQHPQVLVEEDLLLLPQPTVPPPAALDDAVQSDPGLLTPFGTSSSWTVRLVGPSGQPVAGATVFLYGSGVPVQGRTDAQGAVTLSLLNESDATLRALYVNPLSEYWSLWLTQPALTSGQTTTIPLLPLSESFAGFPGTEVVGWGQLAMRMDQVPPHMDGRGVRVAVVDSGAATTHPDLVAARFGVDLTGDPQGATAWRVDTIAHGSHCSGIIAGARDGRGIRGFAPAVELHQCRIFPGGRISSLIDAVDYCIDHEVDVVNMSLGTGGSSQIMLQKLAQAKELGVACVVAAGNTGGGVQFPGTSPDVLTVAAVGQEGTFPGSSYHAQQRWAGGTADRGLFSATFSCHGPQIDVAGPGVAVLSTVPDTGYAAWDGTSMAAPHVAGLAALVLAHHPDFHGTALAAAGAPRVDRLFALLRASATPLQVGDPERVGAGLPDALRALALEGHPPAGAAQAQQAAVRTALAQLAQMMRNAGLLADRPDVVPATLAPSAAAPAQEQPDGAAPPPEVRRGLAELAARMRNAGLAPVAPSVVDLTAVEAGPLPPQQRQYARAGA